MKNFVFGKYFCANKYPFLNPIKYGSHGRKIRSTKATTISNQERFYN